ncbi:MAG TPA: serine/threonine-protein kinase [Polyangiaceae bacterium]|nr:serine/threonine-protein kinase [Polyangiaceae bacterium]
MTDAARLTGAKLGNYRLERMLGRGRMGVVYLARDEALLRPTAVKILSWEIEDHEGQDPQAWFLAEARNVARINHPHVVQIYGVAKHPPHCYIAMEYVPGMGADSWMQDHGPFPARRATEILLQTALALQAAHDAGVVHRDIKPGNLLITGDGAVKLGDFGMALHVASAHAGGRVRAGTPFYTAPEIWCGQTAAPASDLYALGATYYHLLTGNPPFQAANLETLIAAHLNAPLPDHPLLADTPEACWELLRRCLAKSPKERFESAQALSWEARGLLKALNGSASSSQPLSHTMPAAACSGPARTPDAHEVGATPKASRIQHAGDARNILDALKIDPTPKVDPAPKINAPLVAKAAVEQGWWVGLGFDRKPFSELELGEAPYPGEPFAGLWVELLHAFDDAPGEQDSVPARSPRGPLAGNTAGTVLLSGRSGSGRTTLVRRLATEHEPFAPVAYVDLARELEPNLTASRKTWALIRRSFGLLSVPSPNSRELDSLLDQLGHLRPDQSAPALLILDGFEPRHFSRADLALLLRAARATRALRIVLVGGPDLVAQMRECDLWEPRCLAGILTVPPLSAGQTLRYTTDWLRATRAPDRNVILFTPDASLILAHRGEGNLALINRGATSMLRIAQEENRRVLSSWHAWVAAGGSGEALSASPSPPRPWPSAEVLEIINRGRRDAGLPVRSR